MGFEARLAVAAVSAMGVSYYAGARSKQKCEERVKNIIKERFAP